MGTNELAAGGPSAPAPRRDSNAGRREAIALAARALIVEKGFEGLRTRDIAERVGINIATLHYHVPSKEALIELVARSMQEDFIDQSLRRPRAGLSPLTQLRMELDDFRETMLDNPDLGILYSELYDRARRDPKIDAVMRPMHGHWTAIVEGILSRGVADGSLRPDIDPAACAMMLTGAMSDFWRRSVYDLSVFDTLAAELERAVLNPHPAHNSPVED